MKKLYFLFLLLILNGTLLKAQKSIVVLGEIDRAVANQKVWIRYYSNGGACDIRDSALTNSLGKFSYSFTINTSCNFNPVLVDMIGCRNSTDTLHDFGYYKNTGLGPDTINVSFKYCDTCTLSAGFIDSINNRTAKFTNTTKGLNQTYKWYFGDTSNSTSTAKNPTFTYNTFGAYTVCLVVKDTLGICKDSICKTIAVGCNGFYAGFIDTVEGYCLRLYDTSTTQANRWHWSFGDGKTSTNKNTNYTYNRAGNYSLCLAATDTLSGCSDTVCKTIAIGTTNQCFNVGFNFNAPNDTAFFSNTSTNSASGSNIYTWKFGDGQTSTVENPTHIYSSSGTYNVTLIVTDTVRSFTDSATEAVGVGSCGGFIANFNNTINRDTARFINISSSGASVFNWDFGDGRTSSNLNPVHIYNIGNTYNVCLIASDTANGCVDTTCKQIIINTNPSCIGFNANFTYTTFKNTVNTTNLSTSSANKFKWYFNGSIATSTLKSPSYTYSGTKGCVFSYLVHIVAQDTANNCKDSTSKQVVFTSDYLNTGFTFLDSCDNVKFTNTSSSVVTDFKWDFGNTQTSTIANPITTYNSSGNYTVCLIAEDTANICKDTICKTININNSIQGTIFRDNIQLADSGTVWLIKMTIDSITNDTILTPIDSIVFTQPSATYKFDNIASGSYLLKTALLPGAAFYSNRLPTYYVKETRWDKAAFITVNNPCVAGDIVLKTGINPGGAGFISGFVKQGANKVGDPLAKITIVLYNADGSPFGFTNTDINGYYEFTNIAYGDYTVIADVLGKPSEEIKVSISATKPDIYNANFDVNTKNVTISKDATGIVSIVKGKLKIYPNPANNYATVLFNANKTGVATITVMDLTGKTVLSQTTETVAGNNKAELKINELLSGLYIITVNADTTVYVGRIGVNR